MTSFLRLSSSSDFPAHFLRERLRGLYVVTDERWGGGHLAITRAALHGGASIVQLRDKSASLRELLPIAREVRRLTHQHGALFIINDHIDLALLCHSDGVHLGPDDCPVALARQALGPHTLIGASCGSVDEAEFAELSGADYIGVGDIFGTSTKSDAGVPIGIAGLQQIVQSTRLPVAAIGGLSRETIPAVVAAGAYMACVVSAIAKTGDEEAMQQSTRDLIAAAGFD